MGIDSLQQTQSLPFGTLASASRIKSAPAGHQGYNSGINAGVQQTPYTYEKAAEGVTTGRVAYGGESISTEKGIDVLNKKENQELLAYLNGNDTDTYAKLDKSAFDANSIFKSQNNGEVNPIYRQEYGDYNKINLAA